MTEELKELKNCIKIVNEEIDRLNKIKNELEAISNDCEALNYLGSVKIKHTNYPHSSTAHGQIRFEIVVQISDLGDYIKSIAQSSYINDAKFEWNDEKKVWQLTGTYEAKI